MIYKHTKCLLKINQECVHTCVSYINKISVYNQNEEQDHTILLIHLFSQSFIFIYALVKLMSDKY